MDLKKVGILIAKLGGIGLDRDDYEAVVYHIITELTALDQEVFVAGLVALHHKEK